MTDGNFLEMLKSVGVDIPALTSGLAGGMVRSLFTGARKPIEIVSAVIGGALTSNYLSATFSHIVGKAIGDPLDLGVSGFIVGLTAMTICQKLITIIGRWSGKISADGGRNDV